MQDKMIEEFTKDVKSQMSQKRYKHTISVEKTARLLAITYEIDEDLCIVAALGHDYTKEWDLSKNKEIIEKYFSDEDIVEIVPAWHSYTASVILGEKYGFDQRILNAIKYHTLGHIDMDDIAKVVYIADFIEPTRTKNNVKYFLNRVGKISLDELFFEVLDYNLENIRERGLIIPQQTIELYESLI